MFSCNFIKKETLAQVISCEFCESSKNTFFTKYLRMIASFNVCEYALIMPQFAWMLNMFEYICIYLNKKSS